MEAVTFFFTPIPATADCDVNHLWSLAILCPCEKLSYREPEIKELSQKKMEAEHSSKHWYVY